MKTLAERADKIVASRPTYETNRRLIAHLAHERDALLPPCGRHVSPIPTTRQKAIRSHACTRKNWGGNRTDPGAYAANVPGSVIRTAHQQGRRATDVLVEIATSDGASSGLDLPGG